MLLLLLFIHYFTFTSKQLVTYWNCISENRIEILKSSNSNMIYLTFVYLIGEINENFSKPDWLFANFSDLAIVWQRTV